MIQDTLTQIARETADQIQGLSSVRWEATLPFIKASNRRAVEQFAQALKADFMNLLRDAATGGMSTEEVPCYEACIQSIDDLLRSYWKEN